MIEYILTTGFSFKEVLFDQGWIWLIMLIMAIAFIFDVINDIKKKWLK